MKNDRHITQFLYKLFWRALRKIKILQIVVSISLVTIIFLLLVPLAINGEIVFYGDRNLTLSILGSILSGSILFVIIQLVTNTMNKSVDSTYKDFYEDVFSKQGLESIYITRGINDIYKKKIRKSTNRIWAFGMTNANLVDHHLDDIVMRLSSNSDIDVIISFWSSDAKLTFAENSSQISLINQQLKIESKNSVSSEVIESRIKSIIDKFNLSKKSISGRLRIVQSLLPSNFTAFIIDDDIFFFPFIANVDSTTSPTILCNSNRGIGLELIRHFQKTICKPLVYKVAFDSKEAL